MPAELDHAAPGGETAHPDLAELEPADAFQECGFFFG
jgi:hypothetical protein